MPYVNAVGRVLRESAPSTKWLGGTAPGVNVTGTAANETLTGGTNQILTGGPGDDIYGLTGRATVIELPNGGVDTLSVWASAVLPANVENLLMNGGYGWYGFGNELDNIIIGTGGSQQIDGKAGNDVLIGGAGADLFVVTKGEGSDLIVDFSSGSDRIKLAGYGLHSIDDVRAAAVQVGADTILNLSGGEKLVLLGVTATSLVARDFLYDIDLSHYTQTFGDEFNRLSLEVNGGTWRTWYSHNASSDLQSRYHNDEAQIYTDPAFRGTSNSALGLNPFSIRDGVLAITATPLTSAQSSVLGNHTYSSGLITTQTTFSQLYGYFEIRAALPEGQGMWPAFWLLPANGSWPPEIDVFEMLGKDPDTIYFTSHQTENGAHTQQEGQFRLDTSQFHTYGVDWGPDVITFYVDGSQIGSVPTPASMNTPMYMLANLAVGGGWSGAPDATTGTREMLIDYIHAYARTPEPTTPVSGEVVGKNAAGSLIVCWASPEADDKTSSSNPELGQAGHNVAPDVTTISGHDPLVGTVMSIGDSLFVSPIESAVTGALTASVAAELASDASAVHAGAGAGSIELEPSTIASEDAPFIFPSHFDDGLVPDSAIPYPGGNDSGGGGADQSATMNSAWSGASDFFIATGDTTPEGGALFQTLLGHVHDQGDSIPESSVVSLSPMAEMSVHPFTFDLTP